MRIGELFQSDDWKNEKHVPVIDAPDTVSKDDFFEVRVTLGKEVAHPNTTEHHIRWVRLYFKPEDEKFTYEVGSFEFAAHGESVQGADKGPVYTHHEVVAALKIAKPGHLIATSYCNIHGLWESSKAVAVS